MVVGGVVLSTLEAWWRGGPDRILRDRYDRWIHVALPALSSLRTKNVLGSGSNCLWCVGISSLLGRPAADVHFYAGQPAALADRSGRASVRALALDTTPLSPMAELTRRIRPRPSIVVRLWDRPADGNGHWENALAGSTPHPSARVVASDSLSWARATQSQRSSALSLSV